MSPRTRSGWIAGLTVGAAGGFLALEFPSLGWLILLVFAVPAAIVGPRATAIGGLLSGLGGVWLLLFGRTAITCQATGEEIGCYAPGIETWVAVAAGILAIGLALTIVGSIRDRRRR
jgi:hypothetical protein